jgi:hypothetical protein
MLGLFRMDAERERAIRRSHRIEQQVDNILLRVRGIIAKPGVSIEEKERSIDIALEAVHRINPALAEEARATIGPLLEALKARAPARKSVKKGNKSKSNKVTPKNRTMAKYREGLGGTPSRSAAAAAAPMAAAAPRQINVLSSELDDLTRLLQGTSLGPSANAAAGVAAGAPAPPPVPPPSPPYSPSPDAILAELDGLMIRLGHNLHITEGPNYAPRSPRGGRSKRKTKRKSRISPK